MFCSKCGKELSDGAAFCDRCGNPANPAASSDERKDATVTSKVTQDERTRKLIACMSFFLAAAMKLFLFWSLVGTKGKLFIGNGYPDWIVDGWWEDVSWLFIVIALITTIEALIYTFRFYILSYINRSFAEHKKAMVINSVLNAISLVGLPIIGANMVNDRIGYYPIGLICFGIIAAAFSISVAITYSRAADCESSEAFDKKYVSKLAGISGESSGSVEDFWICKKCGSRNSRLSDQCKDCGKYK